MYYRGTRGQYLGMRLLIAGVLFGLSLAKTPAAEAIDSAPQTGLLVLTNGSILQGVVSLEGEQYRVMLPKGELLVRATQVDFFCKNLVEAYFHRRDRCRANSADSHIELARWCVQQGMLEHAMEEISLARSLNSQHRMLDVLTRQIEQLRTFATTNVGVEPEPTSASTEIEFTQTATSTPAQEIPQWARVVFVRRIQPMLIHTCATGGCHSPEASSNLQLEREALAGIGNPELIQQNLDSVVRIVDFDDPESSLLLKHGLTVHGTRGQEQSQVFATRQLAILRAWLAQLTDEQLGEPETAGVAKIGDASGANSANSAQHERHNPELRHPETRDPFDPAQFNDQPSERVEKTPSATPLPPTPEQPLDRPTVAIP